VTARRLRAAVAILSLVGLGLAAYLLHVRYTGGVVACTSGGCETVQSSRYSALLGVPVAALGAAAYVGILASSARRSESAILVGATLSVAGVGFGAYLLYVQLGVIGAICEWCLASDVVMSALAATTLLRLRPAPGGEPRSGAPPSSANRQH
jgi:uncharacterized membrane protein